MGIVIEDGDIDVDQIHSYFAFRIQDLTSDSGSNLPYGEAGQSAWISSCGTNATRLDQIVRIMYSGHAGGSNYSIKFTPDLHSYSGSTGSSSAYDIHLYETPREQSTATGKKQLDEFIGAIKQHMSYGDYSLVFMEAEAGLSEYPKSSVLRKYTELLSPPIVIENELTTTEGIDLNNEWIEEHGDRYSGNWIALSDGHLLASSESLNSLLVEVGGNENVLITKVI